MPPFRYDPGRHIVNDATARQHGTPFLAASGLCGIILKQQNAAWDDAFSAQATIKATEPCYLQTRGEVNVPTTGISSPAQNDLVYIVPTTMALTKTSSGNTAFGRIVEVAPTRGLQPGRCRIDLDIKS